ncbi:MAG: glycosyltransferase family 4 protein [Chloroflexi bacterium]|nr:glycosyltransferase family 4 protein [Chloroflexota bacterium]MBP8058556.1 glycosyltransferase family 4 protein [Chloroflexota bacterium]
MTRIGLYTIVTPNAHTGVGRQLFGLLEGLQQLDTPHEYILYHDRDHPLPPLPPQFRPFPLPVRSLSRRQNHFFQAFALPRLAARHSLDVLHILNTTPLLFPYYPTVVTLYDLTEFALPQRVYETGRHHYRRLSNWLAARRSQAIITTSASTRQDIGHYLGVAMAKVQVVYPGLDHARFRPLDLSARQREEIARTYNLPPRFLLSVGKIQPRKNLARVLQAFREVRRTDSDVHLVLVGSRGWMNEAVDALMAEPDIAAAVHFTGFVPDEVLPALYNLAEIILFPSLYEGFGFPVLEGMACGVPVITSRTSSLGEIAGDAALCVDPLSVEEIAAAIQTLLHDPTLAYSLRQKGLAHAQPFTWHRCARETITCYERVSHAAAPDYPPHVS